MSIFTNLAKSAVKGAYQLSTLGLEMSPHQVIRYRMYHQIAKRMNGHECKSGGRDVLSLSGSQYLASLIPGPNNVINAEYPKYNILDLHQFRDESFDYVVSDQVFEHIEGSPQQAMDESYRLLKPGGIAIHTTCFFNEVHGAPGDYWRFTPDGLRHLCRNWSEVIEADGWGNRFAFFGFRYQQVPEAEWHPIRKIAMHCDPVAPVSVWVIARK